MSARAIVVAIAMVLGCGRSAGPAALTEAALVVGASGTVTDPSGAPVADTQLDFAQDGVALASAITGADGSWSVSLEEGVYDVFVAPPPGSGYAPQALYGQTIGADTSLQIVLIAATVVRYAAHLQDGDGNAIAGMQLCLSGTCTASDENGDAELSVQAGEYALTLTRWGSGSPEDTLPEELSYERYSLVLEEDTTETITLQTVALTGIVVDAEGNPVPHADVWALFDDYPEGGGSTHSNDRDVADETGRFAIAAIAGFGSIVVTPDASTGAPPLRLETTLTGDTDLVIALPASRAYAAHVQDRDGVALAGVELCMAGTGSGACAVSDAAGDATVHVVDGWAQRTIRWTSREGASPQLPDDLVVTTSVLISADTTETITLENRVLRGIVLDPAGSPVAGAALLASVEQRDEPGWARSMDAGTTDASGRFELAVLPGWATIQVTPDPASGLPSVVAHESVAGDADVVITLPASHVYTAHLRDRDGTPLPEVPVCLDGISTGAGACTVTDATGAAVLTVPAGEYTVRVDWWDASWGAPQLPDQLTFQRHVMVAADTTETITIEHRVVEGVVVDADGNPVANATVLGLSYGGWNEVDFLSSTDWATTDAAGRFRLAVAPRGDTLIEITPSSDSGLAPFLLWRSVTEDVSLALLLQFASDGVAEALAAGGTALTDHEGDGATPADPVETAVTTPVEGTVEIHEAPITEAAPSGYTFLTQQVNITAPVASAAAPLVIAITIDGSRIPAGQDATTVPLFRNGVLVPACDAPGIASPDPCVTSRARVGDDVVITALTSAASAWNVGVRQLGDGDGDGLLDDVDVCPIAAEDLDGFQDDDGCPDLDDDGDGVPDAVDACRTEAEDLDGFEDDDGCAEAGPVLADSCPDFDRDGTVTVRDQVVLTRAMGSSLGDGRYQRALDLDRDDDVDVDDLHRLLAQRGTTCPAER